jgi:hypothetical protein
MRNRLFLVFVSLALVLLAGYATLRFTAPTPIDIDAIQKGMTVEEIEALLGCPGSSKKIGFYYCPPSRDVFSPKDQIPLPGGKEWIGEGKSFRITVYVWFDGEGRALGKVGGLIPPAMEESFLAKLRHRLGI